MRKKRKRRKDSEIKVDKMDSTDSTRDHQTKVHRWWRKLVALYKLIRQLQLQNI